MNQSSATRSSLLLRAKDPGDRAAWREFEERYRDLLIRFCRARSLQHADSEDVVQMVFFSVSKSLPQFVYDAQRGRFRDYLFRCVRNAISQWAERSNRQPRALDTREACSIAAGSSDADSGADAQVWHEEWVAHHYRLAYEAIRVDFDGRSLEVFDRNVKGEGVGDLARAFGMSEPAVYALRRRIRDRMQELIAEQIREEDGVNAAAAC